MKSKFLKIVVYTLGTIILLIVLALASVKIFLPNVGNAQDIKIVANQDMIRHGDYLANHVMVCMDCHSTRNWELFSGPLVPGTLGKGGEIFDEDMGFPGTYISGNITPYGVGDWTDGELLRVITTGVDRDGNAMFPVMPYLNYGQLDESDINAVIAYIRTLEPIDFKPGDSKSDFPINFILNTIPKKAQLKDMPPKSVSIEYGNYISLATSCMECHTKHDKGKAVGEPYAGGERFQFPDGTITNSPNITPHATGIGNWSLEQFKNRFRMYVDSTYSPIPVSDGDFKTVMPWTMYGEMDDTDLDALYTYLHSVDPVENVVTRFIPAAE